MRLKLFLSLFFIVEFCLAQSAYKSGEYLKYRVRYGPFNASYATLQLKRESYNDKESFHAIGKGHTTGLAKLFFKVNDTYESYFSTENELPYFFNRDIYEGGYTKKLHFFFNNSDKYVKIKDLEENTEKKMTITPDVRDVISALYYFRNNDKIEKLQIGEQVSLDMIFDDDEIFKFKLRFLGREKISTLFGEINTLVFRPLVQDGRVFKEQESLTLWVTDDANRVPVKIRASLRVGSLIGELVDYNNLKNPTDLKK